MKKPMRTHYTWIDAIIDSALAFVLFSFFVIGCGGCSHEESQPPGTWTVVQGDDTYHRMLKRYEGPQYVRFEKDGRRYCFSGTFHYYQDPEVKP